MARNTPGSFARCFSRVLLLTSTTVYHPVASAHALALLQTIVVYYNGGELFIWRIEPTETAGTGWYQAARLEHPVMVVHSLDADARYVLVFRTCTHANHLHPTRFPPVSAQSGFDRSGLSQPSSTASTSPATVNTSWTYPTHRTGQAQILPHARRSHFDQTSDTSPGEPAGPLPA